MIEPVKVCFVLLKTYAVFRPEMGAEFGGAEVQYYLISRELAKHPNFEVHLINRDYGQPDHEIIDGVQHHKIRQSKNKPGIVQKWSSAQQLLKVFSEVNAEVYFQRCAAIETGLVAWYCRRRQKKFVYSSSSDKDVDPERENKLAFLTGKAFRYGLKKANMVICQNNFQLKKVESRWGLPCKVIPNVVSNIPLKPFPGKKILWVGRAVRSKKPEVFLDLARKHPKMPFQMILSCGPEKDFHQKILSEAKNIENLDVEKFVPFQEIDQIYKKAMLFVSTSEYEGFSNTFLQAMKFGVPILSLHVDTDSIFSEKRTGLFAENNRDLFFNYFDKILKDEELYQDLSRNAYHYVKNHHDIESIIPRYEEVILRLTGENQE